MENVFNKSTNKGNNNLDWNIVIVEGVGYS